MTTLTETLASKPLPAWKAHPLFRHWKRIRDRGDLLRLEVYRPREGLSFAPTRLYVYAAAADGSPKTEPVEYGWDPVANAALIRLQGRCSDPSQEAMRFALMARHVFEPIEVRVGESYFNAVLLELLRSEQYSSSLPELAKMLGEVSREYSPQKGEAYDATVEEIQNAIAELSADLVKEDRLGYSPTEADPILDDALAQYVDERFNITNRKMMGW